MSGSRFDATRKMFEAGGSQQPGSDLPRRDEGVGGSPHSMVKGLIQQHHSLSRKPSDGVKPESLMMASENNTFGLAKRTPPQKRRDYKDTVKYHQLGKEEQEKVAAVASKAVEALKQDNKLKAFLPGQSRSLPTSPRQSSGQPLFPSLGDKPTLAPKPVASSAKPIKPPRPAVLRHVGLGPSGQKPTKSRTRSWGNAAPKSHAAKPPLQKPNYAPPAPPSSANRAQPLKPEPTGGSVDSKDGVQLRTRSGSVPPESESTTDSPVKLPELCRRTMIDDQTPESSPDVGHNRKSHPLSVSDDSFSDSSSFEDSEENSSKQVDNYMNVNFNMGPSSAKRHESVVSEEADQSEEEKKRRKLFKIAEEILTTERTYVSSLKLLVEGFRGTILEANKSSNRPIIPDTEIVRIFSHLPEIYQLNSNLLSELETRIANWDENKKIGDVLSRFAPFLRMYATYTAQFEDCVKTLTDWCKKEERFKRLVREFEATPECRHLAISHYMLEPVQRIPRYKLLLEDYLKRLPEDAEDRQDSEKALKVISEAAAHANQRVKELESFQKLMAVQERLTDTVDLVAPGRMLLKEGILNKCSRRGYDRRMFFLFNDLLMQCSVVSGSFKLRHKQALIGMRLDIPTITDVPNAFSVISTQEKSFMVSASSPEERDEWYKVLSEAITEQGRKMNSLKKQSTMIIDSEEEIGAQAPVWLPDSSATMCMECGRQFTPLRRRHHCRGCGRILCGDCSRNKAFLKFMKREDRVCDLCYFKLKGIWPLHVMNKKGDQRETTAQGVRDIKAHTEGAQKIGYMYCRKGLKGGWTRQWLQLKDLALYFFKAHEDVKAVFTKPLPGYKVEEAQKSEARDRDLVIKLFHSTLKSDLLYLSAESEEDYSSWMEALTKAANME